MKKSKSVEHKPKKVVDRSDGDVVNNKSECSDRRCPIHGSLSTRGRTFKGVVKKKFEKRLVLEFERLLYYKKYERYAKKITRIHAYLPSCLSNEISLGDTVKVSECRHLSKIIHFVVVEKIS
mgnify:CR=1 FL=1